MAGAAFDSNGGSLMKSNAVNVVLGLSLAVAGPVTLSAQGFGGGTPTPVAAIKSACDAAGGLKAFRSLGIIEVNESWEEITQDGHSSTGKSSYFLVAPGPLPGRIEDHTINLIAGDDGSGGWAVINNKVDTRPSTFYMVRRTLNSDLFAFFLPFSLTWEGVTVNAVEPAEVDGRPVWRLKVVFARTFFLSSQTGTSWDIDFDRNSFLIVRAESPFTDLGQGIKADGQRFEWSEPVRVKSVWLRAQQRVTGLDEVGRAKAHTRISKLTYTPLPASAGPKLFGNPIPPDQRPKPPEIKPPTGPGIKP